MEAAHRCNIIQSSHHILGHSKFIDILQAPQEGSLASHLPGTCKLQQSNRHVSGVLVPGKLLASCIH